VLQSEKNAMEISDALDNYTPENAENQTKTHEMDVLEAVENCNTSYLPRQFVGISKV
jgi:hypothetical protein